MRFGRLGELKHGYNAMTTRESDMLMDIGYQLFDENEVVEFQDELQETAFVILTGKVEIAWEGKKEIMERQSLFEENPYCLLVPKATKVYGSPGAADHQRKDFPAGVLPPRGCAGGCVRGRHVEGYRRAYGAYHLRL